MVNQISQLIVLSLAIFCSLRATEGKPNEANNDDNARIVGGTPTTIDVISYIIYMKRDGQFICDGSIVTTTHIVSAAHCVTNENTGAVLAASRYTIHAGTSFLSQEGVVRKVTKIVVPANYNFQNTLTYDVSVLTMASPLPLGPKIATIPLGYNTLAAGTAVRVSGWGLTSENGNVSNQLRTVMLDIVARQKCINDYKGEGTITPTMICASEAGKDSCSGDSGGPLVSDGRLHGIVSWGIGCARSGYPGVYTDVSEVITFIKNNTD